MAREGRIGRCDNRVGSFLAIFRGWAVEQHKFRRRLEAGTVIESANMATQKTKRAYSLPELYFPPNEGQWPAR